MFIKIPVIWKVSISKEMCLFQINGIMEMVKTKNEFLSQQGWETSAFSCSKSEKPVASSSSQNDITAFDGAGRRPNNYFCNHNRCNHKCCFHSSKTAQSCAQMAGLSVETFHGPEHKNCDCYWAASGCEHGKLFEALAGWVWKKSLDAWCSPSLRDLDFKKIWLGHDERAGA